MAFSVGIHPPKTPITKGSGGIAKNTIPNVCKMPGPPAPFVPAPLPNIGKSEMSPKDYSESVKIEGKAVAIRGATFESMGDIASKGTGGGLISANTHGPTKFIAPGSMTVKIEGKSVHLLGEPMLNNCGPSGSPPNTGATMLGIKNPNAQQPACAHTKVRTEVVNRAQKRQDAEAQVQQSQQDLATRNQELANAQATLALPHKLRKAHGATAQLRQAVDQAQARVTTQQADLNAKQRAVKAIDNEDKVLAATNGTNIKVICDDICKQELIEVDCLTPGNKAKEVKSSAGGYNPEQFKKEQKWLEQTQVLGAGVTVEVAVVCPTSAADTAQLEQDNSELAGRTQAHT
jgi:uncharacterized Zn-binding protein involved in type VI secretion